MKTCQTCGIEMSTENVDHIYHVNCKDCLHGKRSETQKIRARRNRMIREDALQSAGMKRVIGPMGGTYWE